MTLPLRILIVKLSSIGDVVHAMPMACALRDHLPQASITWLVESQAAPLLQGHESLDEVIVVPRGWHNFWSPALRALGARLRRGRFDVAIDAQGLRKSALAALLSGARRRVGFSGTLRREPGCAPGADGSPRRMGRQLSWPLSTERVETAADHIVDRNLELLRPLGIASPTVRFAIPRCPQAQRRTEQFVDEQALGTGYAVMACGAGRPGKCWPVDRFAAVAGHLGKAHGLATVVTWGSDSERQRAEAIVAGSEGNARLAPRTSLMELAALAARARIFIASDCGPLHIAAATGTPCVGLLATLSVRRNGPYGRQHIGIQAPLAMEAGGPGVTESQAMLSIGPDLVAEACDAILRREPTCGNR